MFNIYHINEYDKYCMYVICHPVKIMERLISLNEIFDSCILNNNYNYCLSTHPTKYLVTY